jgi:cytochrome c-type biogenesis protein CcmH/NrfG
LLLDRRRIKKWAKWVALFLAIIFVVGFLFMGVGYGGAGFSISSLFTGDKTPTATEQTAEQKLAVFREALVKNPTDITAMLGIATLYQQANNYSNAALYLENVIAIDPSQKDVYLRLANLYMSADMADYKSAATVLNKAISVDPNNAEIYLKLGSAQSYLGNTEAAVLAWQKYLELAPNGDMASVVQEQITKLAATTTTTGATTTTVSGATTTTAASATTTTVTTAP